MTTPLDEILRREPASAETEGQVTQSTAVAQQEMPHGDGADTQVGDAQEPSQAAEGEGDGNRVPVAALQAERGKVKRYTEEVSSLRQEIADRDAAWERRIAKLMEANRPPPPQQPPPDWFDNPQAATQHQLQQTVSPVFEQFGQQLQAIAKDNAIVRFTEEKVTEAENAFLSAMQSGRLDRGDYEKVVSSPNRFAAAVQWHQRQLAQAEIGEDPAAYKERVKAELRKELEAELNGGNGQQQAQQRQQVMPTNFAAARNVGSRSGPAWAGPQPVDSIFATHRTRQ